MKLIIDIDEDTYKCTKKCDSCNGMCHNIEEIYSAIADGIPFRKDPGGIIMVTKEDKIYTDDIKVIDDLHKLTNKYSDIGLSIEIEFIDIGVRIRGYWDHRIDSSHVNVVTFNTLYEYCMFDYGMTLKDAVDMFKENFEKQLKEEK